MSSQQTFYSRLSKLNTLHAAWRHVRQRAVSSDSHQIRDAALEFELDAPRKLRSIQSRLVCHSYAFQLSEGILKDKEERREKGKDPRPIVLATIESRVVQRAILDVLQPHQDDPLYLKIGQLKSVNESPYSFGGKPGGGVPKAISAVVRAISDGFKFYYISDISSFFTAIPHKQVVSFIKTQTNDNDIASIFSNALNVELSNKDRLGKYFDLFPHDGIGVAQGSSLSALAGNILLRDFDEDLNNSPVRMYRYIDDIIILGNTNEDVQKLKSEAKKKLSKFNMSLYDPGEDRDKADEGHIRKGFSYLGCAIHGKQIEPNSGAKHRIINKVRSDLKLSKKQIVAFSGSRKKRNSQVVFSQTLSGIDERLRGWAKSFSFSTSRLAFHQVDAEVDKLLAEYSKWFFELNKGKTPQQQRRMIGVYLTGDVEKTELL